MAPSLRWFRSVALVASVVCLSAACSHHAGHHTTSAANATSAAKDSGTHGHNHSEHHNHAHHAPLAVPAGATVPNLVLNISSDAMTGWNLEIQVTDFEFTPELVNQASTHNQGHAHLYINGEKAARVYGPYFHIPELATGENTVMVTLNANGHEEIQHEGQTIMATVQVLAP